MPPSHSSCLCDKLISALCLCVGVNALPGILLCPHLNVFSSFTLYNLLFELSTSAPGKCLLVMGFIVFCTGTGHKWLATFISPPSPLEAIREGWVWLKTSSAMSKSPTVFVCVFVDYVCRWCLGQWRDGENTLFGPTHPSLPLLTRLLLTPFTRWPLNGPNVQL